MAKLDEDWLGAFIASKVGSAVQWATSPKREEDTDFEDDGNMLRITVAAGVDKPLQLRKVLAVDGDEVDVQISDGFTQILASLRPSAVSILKDELEAEVDENTQNDVFSLQAFTILCPTFAVEERLVTLDVHRLKYWYHLRKAQGTPAPIESRPDIRPFLETLTQLRKSQLVDDELSPSEQASSASVQSSPRSPQFSSQPVQSTSRPLEGPKGLPLSSQPSRSTATTHPRRGGGVMSSRLPYQAPRPQPRSQAAVHPIAAPRQDLPDPLSTRSGHPDPPTQSQNTFPFATQLPAGRTVPPSLASDGLEVVEGINLSGPIAAPGQEVHTRPVKHPMIPGLSSLLSKGTTRYPGLTTTVTTAVEDTESIEPLTYANDETAPGSQSDDAPSDLIEISKLPAENRGDLSPLVVTDLDAPVIEKGKARAVTPQPFSPGDRTKSPPESAHGKLPLGRLPIPQDQRELLNRSSCWFPALPHEIFPFANVPVKLLSEWKWERNLPRPVLQEVPIADLSSKKAAHYEDPTSSRMSSSPSSDSDEPFGSSQWPPTPPPAPRLPPDSSLPTVPARAFPSRPRPSTVVPMSSGQTIQGTPSASQELASSPRTSSRPVSQMLNMDTRARHLQSPQYPKRPQASPQPGSMGSLPSLSPPFNPPKGPRSMMMADKSPNTAKDRSLLASSPVPFNAQTRHTPRLDRNESGATPTSSAGMMRKHQVVRPYESPAQSQQNTGQYAENRRNTGLPQSLAQPSPVYTSNSHSSQYNAVAYNGYQQSSQPHYRSHQQCRVVDGQSERHRPNERQSSTSDASRPSRRSLHSPTNDGATHRTAASTSDQKEHGSTQSVSEESDVGIVIPGTQYPDRSNSQSSIHLRVDPSKRHRIVRRKFLRDEVRQAWILNYCDVESGSQIDRRQACSKFREENPEDTISYGQFKRLFSHALKRSSESGGKPSSDPRDALSKASKNPSSPLESITQTPATHAAATKKQSHASEDGPQIISIPDEDLPAGTYNTTFSIDADRDPASTARQPQPMSSSILDKASMPPPTSTKRKRSIDARSQTETAEHVDRYGALLRLVQRKHAPELRLEKQDPFGEFARKYRRQNQSTGSSLVGGASKEGQGTRPRYQKETSVLDWHL